MPPELSGAALSLSGPETYQKLCAQCHGPNAEGGIGPSLRSAEFRDSNARQDIFDSINLGHPATPMIAWGAILTADQINDVVDFILSLPVSEGGGTGEVSFAAVIKPAIETYCQACHSESFSSGGWIATNYDDVINSGDNGPVVVPGDVDNSLLAQKILGTQEVGNMMPPTKPMPEGTIQAFLDWIAAGAPDN